METKFYKRNFISPGIVSYNDTNEGITLLQKETIDNALGTLKGKPIIITHDGKEQVGEVVDCYYSPETGNYIAGMNIWDKEAQDLLDKEYSISCTYTIIKSKEGGIYHNLQYDNEPTEIEFKNIAIVKKPRYNEAREKLNSIINNEKEEMFGFKKNEVENKKDVCNEDTSDTITFRGKSITPQELLRVIFEEAEFHKGKPVDEKSEAEEKPAENEAPEKAPEKAEAKAEMKAENKKEEKPVENEEVDKRKDIDDVGGFLKSKGLSDEDIRYVMKLMEKSSYNKSEKGTADNGSEDSGNYSHMGRPGKVGGSKVVDPDKDKKDQEKAGEKELEKKAIKPIENSIKEKQNSIREGFKTRSERIAEANKSFYC